MGPQDGVELTLHALDQLVQHVRALEIGAATPPWLSNAELAEEARKRIEANMAEMKKQEGDKQ